MQLSGHTILITGGTSGIGLAFAEKFLAAGSKVIICARRQERLDAVRLQHPAIVTKVADMSSHTSRMQLAEWIKTNHPDTNILMNNAGIQLRMDLTKPIPDDMLHQEMETNFISYAHFTSLMVSQLSGKKDAAIINVSSGLAFAPLAMVPIYSATKAALHSFTMSLRHQLKPLGIKVIEVIPPQVDTDLGYQDRPEPNTTHGGMSIHDFITEAVQGLESGEEEFAVGNSKNMHLKRDEMFPLMNR